MAATSTAQVQAPPAKAGKPRNVVKLGKRDASPATFRKLEPGKVERVPLSILKIEEGLNPRQFNPNDKEDQEFAKSLDSGIVKPIEVRQDESGEIWIMDGHRRVGGARWRLSQNAKLPALQSVPVLLVDSADRTSDVGRRSGYILTSASFKTLTPMQRAKVAARMESEGWSVKAISQRAGVSTKFIQYLLQMAKLPDSIKAFATEDSNKDVGISSFLALQIVQEVGEQRALAAILKAADDYTKKHGYGAHVHLTRKHLHAADEGIPAQVGGTTETRAPQQTVAKPGEEAETTSQGAPTEGGTVPVTAHNRAEPGRAATPATPATPAPAAPKPVDTFRALGMRVIHDGKAFLTATTMADAEAVASFLNQYGFARPAKVG